MSTIKTWVGSSPRSVAEVHMFPMFTDNYGYLVVEPGTNRAACVDPGDGKAVIRACEALNLELVAAWCTHKHADHVGGTELLTSVIPNINIIATKYEPIPHATTLIGDEDSFAFGDLTIRVRHAPCHTKGHVLYFVERTVSDSDKDQSILFSGDTLFVGGCGRFFEGTAADMLRNMDTIASLPSSTQVFCAHEYTEGNYKFLNSVDASRCGAKLAEVQAKRERLLPTVPSTIAEELELNLFMRCRDAALQRALGVSSAEEAMHALRERKNTY